MYKVLLVDDEYFLREALKCSIPWEQYGCEICGEANNGENGILAARKLQPHLILVDINMPIMDGLEMIGKLKEEMPEVLFCILTGYSDFEYAKRGIELGVKDYVVKPVDDKALIGMLQKMTRILDERESQKQEYHSLRFWAEKNTESNKQSFLKMLLMEENSISPQRFAYECDNLHLPLQRGGYGVAVLKADNRLRVDAARTGWLEQIRDILEEQAGGRAYAFYDAGKGYMYFLFGGIRKADWNPADVWAIMQRLQEFFMDELNCAATVGVGTYCEEYKQISGSRKAAEEAMTDLADSELITRMLDYIHKHYGDADLSLREIAGMLYVNYTYLSARFVKEVGMKASQYILNYRMTKAAEELRRGSDNMVKIACSVGYTDVKYFYRCFKKVFGVTPYQYIDLLGTEEKGREGSV